jgi:hypothetical protein
MKQARRDLFKKIGMLGASALAFMGVAKRARAFEGNEHQNPLAGLWDMTIPGSPPLYYKYAISEGAYVCTGNLDQNSSVFGYKYSPTMGTYARTNFRNSYRLRERAWAYDASGNWAGYSDFTGTAVVADDGKSFSGSGVFNQYDVNGNVVFGNQQITYTATKFPPDAPPAAAPAGVNAAGGPRGMGLRRGTQVAR